MNLKIVGNNYNMSYNEIFVENWILTRKTKYLKSYSWSDIVSPKNPFTFIWHQLHGILRFC